MATEGKRAKAFRLDKLSDRQSSMLDYIYSYQNSARRPPTIREIGSAVEISSTSVVNYNLERLKEKGYLRREKEVSRGLQLTEKTGALYGKAARIVTNLIRIPLAGDIVASEPVEVGNDSFSAYDEEDALELSSTMLGTRNTKDLFALKVRGESMIDAMVSDGDIVVMRQQTTARDGDMVAVWLTPSGTTTLKYFYNEGSRIRLQPANPTMDAIMVHPSQVTVQGKVMMVIRQTA